MLYPILANAGKYHSTFYDVVFGTDGVPPFVTSEVGSVTGTSAYAAGVDPGAVFAGPGFDEESGIGAPFGYQPHKVCGTGRKLITGPGRSRSFGAKASGHEKFGRDEKSMSFASTGNAERQCSRS